MRKITVILMALVLSVSSCTKFSNDKILTKYQENVNKHEKEIEGLWLSNVKLVDGKYYQDSNANDEWGFTAFEFKTNGIGGVNHAREIVLNPDTKEIIHFCETPSSNASYYYTENNILYNLKTDGGDLGYKHRESKYEYKIEGDILIIKQTGVDYDALEKRLLKYKGSVKWE